MDSALSTRLLSPEGYYPLEVEICPPSFYSRSKFELKKSCLVLLSDSKSQESSSRNLSLSSTSQTRPARPLESECDRSIGLFPFLVCLNKEELIATVPVWPVKCRLTTMDNMARSVTTKGDVTVVVELPPSLDSNYPPSNQSMEEFNFPARGLVAMGMHSGAVLIVEAPELKSIRLFNSGGKVHSSPVTALCWIQPDCILSGHRNGSIFCWNLSSDSDLEKSISNLGNVGRFRVEHRNPLDTDANPTMHWRFSSTDCSITDMGLAPDRNHVAVSSRDGCVRIVNITREEYVCGTRSRFGSTLCVAWSPDGQMLAFGGEDDMIWLFFFEQSPENAKLIPAARCEGHRAWISSLHFDPFQSDETIFRLVSGAHDCCIALWDINVPILREAVLDLERTNHLESQFNPRLVVSSGDNQMSTLPASEAYRIAVSSPDSSRMGSSVSSRVSVQNSFPSTSSVDSNSVGRRTSTPRVYERDDFREEVDELVSLSCYSLNKMDVLEPECCNFSHDRTVTCIISTPYHIISASKDGIARLWLRPEVLERSLKKLKNAADPQPISDSDSEPTSKVGSCSLSPANKNDENALELREENDDLDQSFISMDDVNVHTSPDSPVTPAKSGRNRK